MKPTSRLPAPSRAQRGVVMIVTLLALVIMLIGAVALVRSFNSSLFMAGNLAFKRDLVNQVERTVPVVIDALENGALSTDAARSNNLQASNYSAQMLPTNDQGIPLALLDNAAFAAVGSAANDIEVAGQAVRMRWVLDRLCSANGSEVTLGAGGCTVGPTPDARGGSASDPNVATQLPQVLYRLSVRVDGPRSTQAFFQTTFAL
jgi:type IV pilus assembly protein PilX